MNIPLTKLKAIILYFSEHTNQQYLGKVKLMKLFYYLDFIHTKRYGTPVTWDQYFHLEKGPIPSTIMNLVAELNTDPESSKLADAVKITQPAGTNMLKVEGMRQFSDKDEQLFSKTELDILREVSERFAQYSTDQIVEASHREAPWRRTKYGQKIPYEYAAYDTDSGFTDEEIRFFQKIAG